jgi:hypothetical protein
VFTTKEVLQIARQAEENKTVKKLRRRPRNGAITLAIEEDKENDIESVSSDSGSDCISVAGSRQL